jgi:hypothetical protein
MLGESITTSRLLWMIRFNQKGGSGQPSALRPVESELARCTRTPDAREEGRLAHRVESGRIEQKDERGKEDDQAADERLNVAARQRRP